VEYEHLLVEQSAGAPLRSMPMFRKARRPRRPVFRVSTEYDIDDDTGGIIYESDRMDGSMDKDDMKNEYGDMSVEDILSEFHSCEDFTDYEAEDESLFDPPEDLPPRKREYAPDINSSFNLGGVRKKETLNYGGKEVDISSDEAYVPPKQESFAETERRTDDDDDDIEAFEESLKVRKRKPSLGKKKKKDKRGRSYQPKYINEEPDEEAEFAKSFRDVTHGFDAYAEAGDYDDDFEDSDGKVSGEDELSDTPDEKEGFPPSFSEYVASLFASVLLRIRGTGKGNSPATMSDDDEDLGPELKPLAASKYYGAYVNTIKIRCLIALILLAVMCYSSIGLPMPGMLGYLPVTAAMCMAIQFTIMLLALDIVTNAIIKMAHLRLGADGLAVLSCILTTVDAIMVVSSKGGVHHMPFCALSSLSLVGVMLSSLYSSRGLRKALRVPAIGKEPIYSVTAESNVKGKDITLLKTQKPATGFVRRTEEAPPDEEMYNRLAPIFLAAALLLTLIVAAVSRDYYDIIFIFSAILAPAVPVTALLCFALPFCMGSMKIFYGCGSGIAGWSGLCDVGQSDNLIVTDRDLFPEGSVSVESIRIFADEDAQKVISYAGSMMIASGCGIASCFVNEMEENKCTMQKVENFECLSGGGMKGLIDGHVVLCGSSELMRLMNVRIPFRLVDKTTVLLAIDGTLYGIFSMKYTASPQVRKALVELIRSNRHPIFALRDFNVTPDMLKDTFDIATDGYDFPPYVERFKITEAKPSKGSKIAAVVCREGLEPLTTMADTGRSMYVVVKINLIVSLLSAVIGMLWVFIKMLQAGSIGLGFILGFMLISAIPVIAASVYLKL
jgi:hypothetical protein